MRIGINGSSHIALGSPLTTIGDHAAEAEAGGFSTHWLAQLAVPDALTAMAATASRTSTIELGTAVIATWTRHPLMLAAQALTVQEATGNRLLLGLGLAHKSMVEASLKIPFDRPAQNMEEYLSVLLPALTERSVSFEGEFWSGEAEALGGAPGAVAPTVMLAAMGPRMLRLAGERTAGTILWLAGPHTVESRIGPALRDAAEAAGRPEPRIVASVPVCVTEQPEVVREQLAGVLANYNDLPSYRGVMDTEGVAGPADVSIVGSESKVRAGIRRFADAGTTDFSALEFVTNANEVAATRSLLVDLLPR